MRKLLPFLLLILAAPAARAQSGFFYQLDPPAPNSTIRVCPLASTGPTPTPCTSPTAIFSDSALTVPAANPASIPFGQYGFWVAAGQYVVQLTGGTNKVFVITLGGSAGGAGTLPRLDQVLNQNTNKLFDQGSATLGFTNGPGLNLSGETSGLTLPNVLSCAPATVGMICYDSAANNFVAYNGSSQIVGVFPNTVTSGHVAGFLQSGGVWSLQDLGPLNGTSGNTILNVNLTNVQNNDSLCFDSTSMQFVNCTEGVPVTVITGTSYTVNCSTDRGGYLIFTATSAIAVSLPQASTSTTCDANFFTYLRTLNATLTVTPTTSTIDDGGGSGSTLVISPGYGTNIFSNPGSPGAYFAKVSPFREGTNALMSVEGFDVNSLGAYQWQSPNNGSTGTTANHMACDDGTGKEIICSHTTASTNVPDGVAVSGIGATPGTTGNVGICIIGYCTVTFDNASVANHFAQQSTTTDGDLHDVGATAPTNGQPYYKIFTGNASPGLAVIRDLTPSEQSAAQVGGGGKTTVQINGTSTQPVANFSSSGQCSNWTSSNTGNTTTAVYHPCHALAFQIGSPGGTALTVASTTTAYLTVPFACTIKAYDLSVDAGTDTVKFWKVATGTAIPTSGNSISTSGVSISSGTHVHSTTLTDFTTTSVAQYDIMAMNVTAVATAAYADGVLFCQE